MLTQKQYEAYKAKKLIRIHEVMRLTGLSKSYIYKLTELGKFPRRVKLVKDGFAVAWLESEIKDFIDSRVAERNLEQ